LSAAARTAFAAEPGLIEPILTGGDDYEVLASVPAGQLEAMRAAAAATGTALTEIGTVTAGHARPSVMLHNKPLNFAQRSFSHF
jgi:thiamine-monophosphate kinase